MSDQDVYFKTGLGSNVAFTTPVGVSSVGPVGPVTVSGIPDTYHLNVDKVVKIPIGVDPVHFAVDSLPKISVGVDPLEVSVRLKEIPSTRTHVPADFSVGLSVLGMQLLCMRLCGEAQVITEPFLPNPCERCDSSLATDDNHG